jgi:hypothetical protein
MEGKNHKKYELIYLTYFVSAFLIFFKWMLVMLIVLFRLFVLMSTLEWPDNWQ